jgi:two-component system chemotaxis response regulator CheY
VNAVSGAEVARERASVRRRPLARSRTLSVLLVEDSALLAARLQESLEVMPEVGDVRTVDRETAAIDALDGCDVVVLDLHLKQGNGFGVLRALGARTGPAPLVIVFTNHDVPGYRRRAAALGAEHFLDKARDFERLGELLRALHARRYSGDLPEA